MSVQRALAAERRRWKRPARPVATGAVLAVVAAYCLVRFRDAVLLFFFLDDFWNLSEVARLDVRSPLDLWQFLRPNHNGFTLYRPLTQTVYFAALRALFGHDAAGYHAVQLLAQVANAWLVLLVTRRLTASTAAGLAAALIYASAPGHLGAVYWVAAFTMTGTTLLLLLMLWWWLSTSGRMRAVGVTVLQAAALLASEHGVIGPVLLVVVAAFGPVRESWRRLLPQLAGPSILVMAYVAAKLVYLGWLQPMPPGFPYAPSWDAAGWVRRTGHYALACVPGLRLREWPGPARMALGGALLALVPLTAVLCWRRGPRFGPLAIGSAVFIAGLLPVLPLAAHAYDYYVGTAAAGAALVLAGCCTAAGRHAPFLALALGLAAVVVDARTRAQVVLRDPHVQFILHGSAASARWLMTIAEVPAAYPHVREVLVPADVVTRWMVESGGHRVFLPPVPAVTLFDRRQRPVVGPEQAVVWAPAAVPLRSAAYPGARRQLDWLRALAGEKDPGRERQVPR